MLRPDPWQTGHSIFKTPEPTGASSLPTVPLLHIVKNCRLYLAPLSELCETQRQQRCHRGEHIYLIPAIKYHFDLTIHAFILQQSLPTCSARRYRQSLKTLFPRSILRHMQPCPRGNRNFTHRHTREFCRCIETSRPLSARSR